MLQRPTTLCSQAPTAPSTKSRAARRETTPPTGTDKSPKPSTDDSKTTEPDLSVLAARQGAGITKKQKKQKPLSRQQRLRKEKGLVRAEAVTDQLQRKVGESKRKGKKIKARRAAWEDLNGTPKVELAGKNEATLEKMQVDAEEQEGDHEVDPAAALVMDTEDAEEDTALSSGQGQQEEAVDMIT